MNHKKELLRSLCAVLSLDVSQPQHAQAQSRCIVVGLKTRLSFENHFFGNQTNHGATILMIRRGFS